MATGFDRRQTTRDTFAFQPAAASQGQSAASGQSRDSQVIGGDSKGGFEAAGPQTDAGPIADGLGRFVQQIMEPHVQARQTEEFFKGFNRARAGEAMDQLDAHSGSLTNKIFGHASFEQGAEAFTAKAALDKWTSDRMAERDTLKRMTPDESAKVLSKTSQAIMTGNAGVDQMLQSGLVEASAPLMNTIAKDRAVFQQSEFKNAYGQQISAAATLLQQIGDGQADHPDDGVTVPNAEATFAGAMVRPANMDDATWQDSLKGTYQQALQAGNIRAVNVMEDHGILNVFDPEDQAKMEDMKDKYSQRALSRAASTPARIQERQDLDTDIKMARVNPDGAVARGRAYNEHLMRDTGVRDPLYDAKDLLQLGYTTTDAVIAAENKRQALAQARADRDEERAYKRSEADREENETAARAQILFNSGQAQDGIDGGVGKTGDYETMSKQAYRSGNFKVLSDNYNAGGYVSTAAAKAMQAPIRSSTGQPEYGKDFERAHAEFAKADAQSNSMARAYYDDLYVPMKNYEDLSHSMTPKMAYQAAFGNTAQYTSGAVSGPRRGATNDSITQYVKEREPYQFMGTSLNPFARKRVAFNESSVAQFSDSIREQVQIGVNVGGDFSKVTPMEEARMFKAGKGEEYGQFFWKTPPGTPTIGKLIGLQPEEATDVVVDLMDKRLKAAGFSDGAYGQNYTNVRIRDEHNQPALLVNAYDKDGDATQVMIPIADFKASADAKRNSEVRGNQPVAAIAARKAVDAGLDPNRHVAGETGLTRVTRINAETKVAYDRKAPTGASLKPVARVVGQALARTAPGQVALVGANVAARVTTNLSSRIAASTAKRKARHNPIK